MPSHITNSRSLHMPHAAETERKQCKEKTRHRAAKTFVALWEATEFHSSLQSSQELKTPWWLGGQGSTRVGVVLGSMLGPDSFSGRCVRIKRGSDSTGRAGHPAGVKHMPQSPSKLQLSFCDCVVVAHKTKRVQWWQCLVVSCMHKRHRLPRVCAMHVIKERAQ